MEIVDDVETILRTVNRLKGFNASVLDLVHFSDLFHESFLITCFPLIKLDRLDYFLLLRGIIKAQVAFYQTGMSIEEYKLFDSVFL